MVPACIPRAETIPARAQHALLHLLQGLQEGGSHVELQFDMAAAELALLPRAKLLPLAQPEAALADAADVLGAAAMPQMLAALLTLRRVAIHHKHLLVGSLGDTAALLLECMHSGDAAVAQAAVMALLDLLATFGNAMLRHLEPPPPADQRSLPQQHSCLLALLMAAALGSTPSIRHWADEALRCTGWPVQRPCLSLQWQVAQRAELDPPASSPLPLPQLPGLAPAPGPGSGCPGALHRACAGGGAPGGIAPPHVRHIPAA